MRLLVLGGTSFVGRAVAEAALRRGYEVTTLNRGRTGADVPGAEVVRGDRSRDRGLAALGHRSFDAAVDTGLVPAQVLRAVRELSPRVPFYGYVSSVSAYRDWEQSPAPEDAPLQDGRPDEDGDPADLSAYGRRKAGCERAVRTRYGPESALVLRPGVIVGPHDNVGHLPWWLGRTARGGPVLVPGDPLRSVQLLDVRDLAAFLLDRVDARSGGVFNAVPDLPATMQDWLAGCAATTGASAELTWVDDGFLLAGAVQEWDELPFWLADTPARRAAWSVPGTAAADAGLRCRSPQDTVEDTWRWLCGGGIVRPMPGLPPIGLNPAKERHLLSTWAGRPAALAPSTVETER